MINFERGSELRTELAQSGDETTWKFCLEGIINSSVVSPSDNGARHYSHFGRFVEIPRLSSIGLSFAPGIRRPQFPGVHRAPCRRCIPDEVRRRPAFLLIVKKKAPQSDCFVGVDCGAGGMATQLSDVIYIFFNLRNVAKLGINSKYFQPPKK